MNIEKTLDNCIVKVNHLKNDLELLKRSLEEECCKSKLRGGLAK